MNVRGRGMLTDVILAILGLPKLINQKLKGIRRGTNKAQTPQVAHLFSLGIFQPAKEGSVRIWKRMEGGRGEKWEATR